MNKLDRYRNCMIVLNELTQQCDEFKQIEEKFDRAYSEMYNEVLQALEKKLNNVDNKNEIKYYKNCLEKLRGANG